jgi:hypothetical protein
VAIYSGYEIFLKSLKENTVEIKGFPPEGKKKKNSILQAKKKKNFFIFSSDPKRAKKIF